MKRLILCASIFMLLALPGVTTSNAAVEWASPTTGVEANRDQVLRNRLKELKSVDKSALTVRQRREWRQEVRQVNSELGEPRGGGGIWISLGPLLVVILLIIILA